MKLSLTLAVFIVILHTILANNHSPIVCKKINLLYTWVDGNDPVHQITLARRLGKSDGEAAFSSRFRDMDGLLFSLRSVEMNAPWVDKIFIYTAKQIPQFLNFTHPKIKMIFHHEVFPNKDDLPTFSSNAIEASFPYLPDEVGPCFIYLNDDMFFGNKVSKDDFLIGTAQNLYTDGAFEAPVSEEVQNWDPWHKMITKSNSLLDKEFGVAKRKYTAHGAYFFSLEVLRNMEKTFGADLRVTRSRPFRTTDDIVFPFFYHHFTAELYQSITPDRSIVRWFGLQSTNADKVCEGLKSIGENKPKIVCLNDQMKDSPNAQVIQCSIDLMGDLFPYRSQFEKKSVCA